ncbi:PAS domain S-box-containing protein [Chelatococcus asaccharovorans]|uniref:histidine kinase n=3 Tax=Chelatococcus asaccharovorans TaxID=28210 RepID=A0A2V3U3N9_9HYPH|nr:PAS domain S-box-containing protein [Chelatococcus asaccharovorans]
MIADLRRDTSLAPFLKSRTAVIVWSMAKSRVVWASAEARPLVAALTEDHTQAPTPETHNRLMRLATALPAHGVRLERWRVNSRRQSDIVTLACRPVATADGQELLVTVVVGALPRAMAGSSSRLEPEPEGASVAMAETKPAAVVSPQPPDLLTQIRTLASTRRSLRFVWASDTTGRLLRVSPELATVVGGHAADIVGRRWDELIGGVVRDPQGCVAAALARRQTWPRCAVLWQVGEGEALLPVELGALLVTADGEATFQGYGLCRLGDVQDQTFQDAKLQDARTEDTEVQDARPPGALRAAVPAGVGKAGAGAAAATSRMPDAEAVEPPVAGRENRAADTTSVPPKAFAPDGPPRETVARETVAIVAPDVSAAQAVRDTMGMNQPEVVPVETVAAETEATESALQNEGPNQAPLDHAPEHEEPLDEAVRDEIPSSENPSTEPPSAETPSTEEPVGGAALPTAPHLAPAAPPNPGSEIAPDDGIAQSGPVVEASADETSAVEAVVAEDGVSREERFEVSDGEAGGSASHGDAAPALDAGGEGEQVGEARVAPVRPTEPPANDQGATDSAPQAPAEGVGEAAGSFAPVRGQVRATLGTPKVVPLRVVETVRDPADEADGRPPQRPTLSTNERNAFREIARALGARYLGEEDPGGQTAQGGPQPAGPPPQSPAREVPQTEEQRASEHGAPEATADGKPERPVTDTVAVRAQDRKGARAINYVGERPSFAPLTDKLPIGILVSRGDDILYANRTLLDFLGYADITGLAAVGLWDLFTSRAQVGDGAAPIALKAANGDDLAVDARLTTLEWNGAPATLLSFRRSLEPEIAERIHALEGELVLHEGQARELSQILDTATDGVIILDDAGRILSLNRSAEALFGYDEGDVVGEFFTLLLAPESHVVAVDYLEGLKAGGVASVMNDGREVVGRVRQGGLSPLTITMGRVSEPPNRKFCVVARDMTAFKKAEADLMKAKKAAEEASAQKSDFLAKISHEIRTPLNAIIGFAEVMQEERFGPIGNERYKEYLNDIHVSGGHVISLVNDLLDLAKIEAGRLDLNFASVNLNEVVAGCVALMQPQVGRSRIVLRTSLAPKLPPVVADERAMRQVVLNILSNAVKFTDAGGQVIVSTALTDRGEIALRVRDTGIGMSVAEIEQALEPFRQLATARRHGGTGLGLPLTKALVEANRGALSITSAKREGTLVEIVLPRTRVLAE